MLLSATVWPVCPHGHATHLPPAFGPVLGGFFVPEKFSGPYASALCCCRGSDAHEGADELVALQQAISALAGSFLIEGEHAVGFYAGSIDGEGDGLVGVGAQMARSGMVWQQGHGHGLACSRFPRGREPRGWA